VELELKVPRSWYINAVATFESERGRGVARSLIADAEVQAVDHDVDQISLIVASANLRARKLYQYLGFDVVDSLPVVPYPGSFYDGDWLLMNKTIH
jgi:ribosomal protein S18 acetylase RimI-like enzyme